MEGGEFGPAPMPTPCRAPSLIEAVADLGERLDGMEGSSLASARSLRTLLLAGLVADSVGIRTHLENVELLTQPIIRRAANTYLAIHDSVLRALHDEPGIQPRVAPVLEECMDIVKGHALVLKDWQSSSLLYYFGEVADVEPFCAALEEYESLVAEFVLEIRCGEMTRSV